MSTIVLTSSKNPSKTCKSVTFTSTVTGNGGILGFVVFYIDQEYASLPIQIDGNGVATYVYKFEKACKKSHTVTAYYFNIASNPSTSIIQKVCS